MNGLYTSIAVAYQENALPTHFQIEVVLAKWQIAANGLGKAFLGLAVVARNRGA
jgi:hypothetical protein